MNSKAFTFFSFLPALAYWYLEANYDLKIALVGGMILSIIEMTVEKIFTKHLHAFSKLNFVLVVGLGGLSLMAKDGIWFKLQPAIGSFVMAIIFGWKSWKGESFLQEMAATSSPKHPIPLDFFNQLEKHLSLFLLSYGAMMAILAFVSNTSWWLFGKTGGFYLLFFLFLIVEFVLMRKRLGRPSISTQIEQHFKPDFFQTANWLVVSVNSHYFNRKARNFIFEWHHPNDKQLINIEAEGDYPRLLDWNGRHFQLMNHAEWMRVSNRLIHFSLAELSSRFQADVLAPVHSNEVPADEDRALQWLETSLKVLKEGIKAKITPGKGLLQTMIFGGINPEDHRKSLRVICFNIDLFLFFHDDGRLQLTVFNDRDNGVGTSKAPSLNALFGKKKAQVLNEVIQLIVLIGQNVDCNLSVDLKS